MKDDARIFLTGNVMRNEAIAAAAGIQHFRADASIIETRKAVVTGGVVIRGGHTWAYGPNVASAKAKFTRFGGWLSHGYTITTIGEATEFDGVDNFGRIHYFGPAALHTREVAARKSARKGWR